MPKRLIIFNTILFITSLLLSLFATELFFRSFYPQPLHGSWLIFNDKGLKVNKIGGSANHVKPNNEIIKYNFGNFHNRGYVDPNCKFKILALGDSYTFGWQVEFNESYIGILQNYIKTEIDKNFCIINSSVIGWGTSDYIAFVEDYIDIFKPEIILIFLHTDDIERSINGRYSLSFDGSILSRNIKKPPIYKRIIEQHHGIYNFFIQNFHSIQLLRNILSSAKKNNITSHKFNKNLNVIVPKTQNVIVPKTQNVIVPKTQLDYNSNYEYSDMLIKSLFEYLIKITKGKSKLFITTPGYHGVYDNNTKLSNIKDLTDRFIYIANDFFKSRSIKYYDISKDVIEGNYKFKYLKDDGHPDIDTHKMIADIVWNKFLKRTIINKF